MKTSLLSKSVAGCGVCLGLISWASVAAAGLTPDTTVVSVNNAKTNMYGTTYGTSLSAGTYMECYVRGDAWFHYHAGHCSGKDAQGDFFECWTEDPGLILAIQTMPDYQRLSVYATGYAQECIGIYSYRGSRYLPPGAAGGGHPEVAATNSDASGSFYGARVSADTTQYVSCTVYDTPGYASVACQAKDVAGDYFYCSSTDEHVVATVRNAKDYTEFDFYRDIYTGDCVEMMMFNGSDGLP